MAAAGDTGRSRERHGALRRVKERASHHQTRLPLPPTPVAAAAARVAASERASTVLIRGCTASAAAATRRCSGPRALCPVATAAVTGTRTGRVLLYIYCIYVPHESKQYCVRLHNLQPRLLHPLPPFDWRDLLGKRWEVRIGLSVSK